jgi:hypothetical protein
MSLIDQLGHLFMAMSLPIGFFWWVTKDLERVAAKASR